MFFHQILERCIEMLSFEDPRVRLVTMDTITSAMKALKDHESKKIHTVLYKMTDLHKEIQILFYLFI